LILSQNQRRLYECKTKGGYREGAGRKAIYDEPTKTMRVPVSRIVEIKNFLACNKKATFNDVASITLINPTTFKRIPLASEKVAAGFPSPAQDYIDKTLDMNEHLVKNEAATFVVKVASLSMRDAGIEIDDE
jgi:DNA polymerase V